MSTPCFGYDLLESDGTLHNYAGAQFFGSPSTTPALRSPIVAGAATADGGGYWMVAASGTLYTFGDATNYGAPAHVPAPVAAIERTPDDNGYWIVTRKGGVYNYGDAAFFGSPVHKHLRGVVVGFAPTPDGKGYWIVTGAGSIYNFGDAAFFGSPVHKFLSLPVVGIAATADGAGYWVATGAGDLYNYGDAAFFGSPVHILAAHPVVSFATTADGRGYWFSNAKGRVFNYGDAHFGGSLSHAPPTAPVVVVGVLAALAVSEGTVAPFPHSIVGYDISNYQCKSSGSAAISPSLPSVSALTVIEVAGWLDDSSNSCLANEAAWANAAQRNAGPNSTPYNLYLFVNSPDTAPGALALDKTGPRGTCSTLVALAVANCIAYNYGFNGARSAFAYAASEGVHSNLWWIDVENSTLSTTNYANLTAGRYWSDSLALNDATIQGTIDALRGDGVEVGIYSTSLQFPKIAGTFVPVGAPVPLWIAGAPWTSPPYKNPKNTTLPAPSVLANWCAGTARYIGSTAPNDLFAGGIPWMLQETPGTATSPYNLDPDYAC